MFSPFFTEEVEQLLTYVVESSKVGTIRPEFSVDDLFLKWLSKATQSQCCLFRRASVGKFLKLTLADILDVWFISLL